MTQGYDYGRTARLGVGTPQANPTVEAEFGILLPRSCSFHTVRLTGTPDDPATRLREYLTNLPAHLARYDIFRPDIFGFACTGSSYLLGLDGEAAEVERASSHAGYAVVTASQALRWALERHAARRIIIVAPYPRWLLAESERYWTACGFTVVAIEQIETGSADTRSIYALGSDAALARLAALDLQGVDAVLLSGTGMPSLAAVARARIGRPVLSSNMCLAARLLDGAGHAALLDASGQILGWRPRLAEALES
jgi:maleate isomerase